MVSTNAYVGRGIQTQKSGLLRIMATNTKYHGLSQAVSPDAAVLVSYHSIVLQMASFDRPQTQLSEDAICNPIE